jgi:hypothetical protein
MGRRIYDAGREKAVGERSVDVRRSCRGRVDIWRYPIDIEVDC